MENDIQPQVFFDDFPNWVLYVRDVPQGGGWRDVLVADTHKPEPPTVFMARRPTSARPRRRGRCPWCCTTAPGIRRRPDGRQIETFRFAELLVKMDPDTVFRRTESCQRGRERNDASATCGARRPSKRRAGVSPHPEIMAIQQKFSFPAACLVFAIIGLALGPDRRARRQDGGVRRRDRRHLRLLHR